MVEEQVKVVNRKELAAALKISVQRLGQLLKKDVITERHEGGFDLYKALGQYQANIDHSKRSAFDQRRQRAQLAVVKGGKKGSRKADKAGGRPSGAGLPVSADLFDYNAAKARKEHHNAELAQIRAETARGDLLPRAEVTAREFAVARKIRDRILGWPARLANYVPPEAMSVLTEECEALIREMQDDVSKITAA